MMGTFALFCNFFDDGGMSSHLSDYDYALPPELVAGRPLPQRDDSRMMILRRDGETIEHRRFREFKEFLVPDDLVVLNDTRVLAARKFSDGGAIEFLFLERLGPKRWKCLLKPGRKMRVGATTRINHVTAHVVEVLPEGERILELDAEIDPYEGGTMPVPPYLGRMGDAEDIMRYQTVFAQRPGAVAAPTAGLHFTEQTLREVPHTFVTLHVGAGTFRPVQSENIADHRMHAEQFEISPESAARINEARRLVAVGTTTLRVLESAQRVDGKVTPQEGSTGIFIYPPYQFELVDALLTNFHLPRSTLLMLVSAFAGRDFILRAYAEAIRERYRFYSYGDCMLIL
jgi:S-adenosylmethionine:tRNA ribosyltransferase-isomerase